MCLMQLTNEQENTLEQKRYVPDLLGGGLKHTAFYRVKLQHVAPTRNMRYAQFYQVKNGLKADSKVSLRA